MNFSDKKLPIIIILLIFIFIIAVYFFTKDHSSEFISTNELLLTSEPTKSTNEIEKIVVHIDGEVLNPGLVYLSSGARIADAIEEAGGLSELANISNINLAYTIRDGQKIHIPSIYEADEESLIQDDAGENIIKSDNSSNSSKININTATQTELESLPGIGSSTATKIIDYRNKNGNFKTIEDIMNVNGIGESKFNNIKDYISI